jgi:hypothetical protein
MYQTFSDVVAEFLGDNVGWGGVLFATPIFRKHKDIRCGARCKVLGCFVCLNPQLLDLIKFLLRPSYLSCREAEYAHRHAVKEFLGCFCLQGVVGKYY